MNLKKYKHRKTGNIATLVKKHRDKKGVCFYFCFGDRSCGWFPKRFVDRDFEILKD